MTSRIRELWLRGAFVFLAIALALSSACGAPAGTSAASGAAPAPQAPQQAPVAQAPPAAAPAVEAGPFSGAAAREHVARLAAGIGSRPAGSSGTAAAATYIAERLAGFGYEVERQPFTFPEFQDRQSDLLAGGEAVPAAAMVFSAPGDVSGPLVFAGFGREADFPARIDGAIALVERGAQVTFRNKVAAAAAAGAAAVVIHNSAPQGFGGSLQVPSDVPVLAISGEAGQRLRQRLTTGPVTVRATVDAALAEQPAANVIARRPSAAGAGDTGGAPLVVVGAHFDSVAAGPGANDNASGTGLLLELARTLAADPGVAPGVEVVFVAFDAEEVGLLGSAHYVADLPPDVRARVRAMLNFDMVGVGDALRVGGHPSLVALAEEAARERQLSLGRLGNDLSGASDHASFAAAGIPAVFFHVTEDPNYHTAGDVAELVSAERLQQMGDLGAGVLRRLAGA